MTQQQLRSRTRKQLAAMAREHHVAGWHSMRKDELIDALVAHSRRLSSHNVMKPGELDRIPGEPPGRHAHRPLRPAESDRRQSADRVAVEVVDSWWLHVRWTISRQSLGRAEAALGIEWHRAVPVLRVYDVTNEDESTATRAWVEDIPIHGDVCHWYVPVRKPGRTFRIAIGYRGRDGRFFSLARSARIRPHAPNSAAESARSQNGRSPAPNGVGNGASRLAETLQTQRMRHRATRDGRRVHDNSGQRDAFHVQFDTEIIIRGRTDPRAALSCLGEAVPLDADGSFSLRFALPEGRQVIPATAVTPSGREQRTFILAIERNTRQLEAQRLDELD